jgi:sRNA-binding carbon storage regulator CsrA
VIDGGITVTVIEIRAGKIRLEIKVRKEISLRQVEERSVAAWLQ